MTRNNEPGIIPRPCNPFTAPLLVLDADGVPAVVAGGGVPAVAPDEPPLVPVPVVGPLNELLTAGVAVVDTLSLLVMVLLNLDVVAKSVHTPT